MKARISDATIIYSTLDENSEEIHHFERVLKKGCRFISYGVPLVGIKPDGKDGLFFRMRMPFKRAKDEEDWASSVLQTKNASSIKLYRKYRRWFGRKFVRYLKKVLSGRLKYWNMKS